MTIRLGINVDHVATIRQARGEPYPNPTQAAVMAELGGADNITCHLREDRRHIQDADVANLKNTINIPLNFEMAATDEMLDIACETKPHSVTLVPEKRQELTTEGGLDVERSKERLAPAIKRLNAANILVALFIEPDKKVIELTQELGAGAIEIHTGDFCHKMDAAITTKEKWTLVQPLIEAANFSHSLGLQTHFGHGLHYGNAHWLQTIEHAEEANIGHAVISRAIFSGLTEAVKEMKSLINDPAHHP